MNNKDNKKEKIKFFSDDAFSPLTELFLRASMVRVIIKEDKKEKE